MEETEDRDLYLRYLICKKKRLEERKCELEKTAIELMLQEEKMKLTQE